MKIESFFGKYRIGLIMIPTIILMVGMFWGNPICLIEMEPPKVNAQSMALDSTATTVYLSSRTIRHIQERHWPDSTARGAGKYAPGITVQTLRDMINEAVASGRSRPNTNGRPGQIYEYDFGHPIGTTIDGGAATRLRVVVSPRGQVVTAFPI